MSWKQSVISLQVLQIFSILDKKNTQPFHLLQKNNLQKVISTEVPGKSLLPLVSATFL